MTKLLQLVTRLDEFVGEPTEENGRKESGRRSDEQDSGPDPATREVTREASAPPQQGDPAGPRGAAGSPGASRRRQGRSRLLGRQPAASEPPTFPPMAMNVGSPLRRLHGRVLAAVEAFFDAARRRDQAPEELAGAATRLVVVADELVDEVRASEEMVALAMAPYAAATTFVVPHSVNVAVFGVRIAVGAGLSEERTRIICQTGLTHDVGFLEQDSNPQEPGPAPDDVEPGEMYRWPARSREILEEVGPPLTAAARVVHQVHERLDGSGYPGKLSGEDILVESRVIGAADLLDGVVHPDPYELDRVSGSGGLGVRELMRMRQQFGEEVLKGVVRGIGLFPAGTLVRLSSGEVALVKENRPDNPMRPLVEVLEIAGGPGSGRSRALDLVRTPHVYVSGVLSTADLEELTGGSPKDDSAREEPASGNP